MRTNSSSVRLIIIAVAVLVGVTATALVAIALFSTRGPTACCPQPNPIGGYAIELSRAGGYFESLTIDSSGEACQSLGDDNTATICLWATNLLPSKIGSGAYGRLNVQRTPQFYALVWRARADADATVCGRGGLEGDFKRECEADATSADYVFSNPTGTFRVRIPIGGAAASGSPSGS